MSSDPAKHTCCCKAYGLLQSSGGAAGPPFPHGLTVSDLFQTSLKQLQPADCLLSDMMVKLIIHENCHMSVTFSHGVSLCLF